MPRIHLLASSSTKLALLFSGLLCVGLLLLGLEITAITHGNRVHPMYTKMVFALVMCVCAGLFILSYFVTKRINNIADTASQIIATGDLSRRIPISNRWDDLSKLATLLNAMLAEVEQLVSGIRTLSDNIAHDLRHPLTRLRNHLEEIRKETPESEQQQKLAELTTECDALLTTFQALLRISNIESGKRHTGLKPIDLARLLEDVVELYDPLAAEKSIQLSYTPNALEVTGDKDLLFQSFANLVDNAIKYTPEGGSICIEIQPLERGGRVIIRDTGQGVSDEHKQRVFRRFYRVDGSRSSPGSGLGLSLVAAIVKLHHGHIQLHDNSPQGLTVTVTL